MSILNRLEVGAAVKGRQIGFTRYGHVFGALCGEIGCDPAVVVARHIDYLEYFGTRYPVYGYCTECRDKDGRWADYVAAPGCVPLPGIGNIIKASFQDNFYCPAGHCAETELIFSGADTGTGTGEGTWNGHLDLPCGTANITLDFIDVGGICVPRARVSGCDGNVYETIGDGDSVVCWHPFYATLSPLDMGRCCRCGPGVNDNGSLIMALKGLLPPVKPARFVGFEGDTPVYALQDCCELDVCKVGSDCCPDGLPTTLTGILRTEPGPDPDGCDCLNGLEFGLTYIGNIDTGVGLQPVWKSDEISCVTSYGCTVKFTFFLTCGSFTEGVLNEQKPEYLPAGSGTSIVCPEVTCTGPYFSLMAWFEYVGDNEPGTAGCDGCGVAFQNFGWYCWGCVTVTQCDPLYLDFGTEDFSASSCDGAICNVGVEITSAA